MQQTDRERPECAQGEGRIFSLLWFSKLSLGAVSRMKLTGIHFSGKWSFPILFAGVCLCIVLAFAVRHAVTRETFAPAASKHLAQSQTSAKPFTDIKISAGTRQYNLAQGEYMVAMLNTSCEHCRETVQQLNAFASLTHGPQVVGLMLGDAETLDSFKRDTNPRFPLRLLDDNTFFSLIGDAPPRLIYTVEAVQKGFWDEPLPENMDLMTEIERLRNKL